MDPLEEAMKDLRERIARKLEGYAETKQTPRTAEAALISATQMAAAATVRSVPLNAKSKQFTPPEQQS